MPHKKANLVVHELGPQTTRESKKSVPIVSEQIERLLAHLDLEGDHHLKPVEQRKGGSQYRGLRVQTYDTNDPNRPVVKLIAQPGGNDGCWLWALQFPPGTDAMLMHAKMSVAIEEGYHLADSVAAEPVAEPRANVVPIRGDMVLEPPLESAVREPLDLAGILGDDVLLLNLLSYVFGRVREGGHGKTIELGVAYQEVVAQLGQDCSTRDAEKVVLAFEKKTWVKRNANNRSITFTQAGVEVLLKAGASVGDVAPEVPREVTIDTSSVIVNDHGDLEQRIRQLSEKARKYADAQQKIPAHEQDVAEIKHELDGLEARLSVLRAELDEKTRVLDSLRQISQSNDYANAAAEFERIKSLFR